MRCVLADPLPTGSKPDTWSPGLWLPVRITAMESGILLAGQTPSPKHVAKPGVEPLHIKVTRFFRRSRENVIGRGSFRGIPGKAGRLLAPLSIAASLMVASVTARAEQQWKTDAGQQPVFTAALYTDDNARIVVSCRMSTYLSPEVSLTIVPPGKPEGADSAEAQTTFQTKEKAYQVKLTRIGVSEGQAAAWRWDVLGPVAMKAMRELADAADENPLTVTLPGYKPVTFTSGYENSSAFRDTVLRCAPSVVRARRQAATSNLQSLLTLEGDANDRCRGGGVDDVWAACAERTEYVEALHVRGMCYGKQGQIGADMVWHRCGPGSIR